MNRYTVKPTHKAIKEQVRVGKYDWDTDLGKRLGIGASARVCTIPDQPDLVAVYTKSKIKRDWYEHIGLLLGESTFSGGYVFIIPLMESGMLAGRKQLDEAVMGGFEPDDFPADSRPPDILIRRNKGGAYPINVIAGYQMPIIRYLMTPNKPKWYNESISKFCRQAAEFFDKYPEWLMKSFIDLHDGNVMYYNGQPVFTDPFEAR